MVLAWAFHLLVLWGTSIIIGFSPSHGKGRKVNNYQEDLLAQRAPLNEFKTIEHLSRVSPSDHAKQVFTQRKSNSALQRYVIPSGGLFRFATMLHYFCELVSWLGLARVTQQFNAFIIVADTIAYLAGCSVATTR
eukprot:gnl/MRDRNA2_/MRDRNA2_45108_c0_seq1.p1 gnl/MRDRNA2_/MRDRNA2_45108_c0~~gnl/MRDRNA2_/MRDRNA2_45108_c0_seq1.p1  ORF type:complete len:135 (-),score=3.08 gnl/MRDRNA2_/MRDRNA2_45108_c0_seq1:179-583(-)